MIEIKEQNNFLLQKYGFQWAVSLGMSAEQLIKVTQDLLTDVAKHDDSIESDLSDAREQVRTIESRFSQVTAILNHNRHLFMDRKARRQGLLSGGVQIIKDIIQSISLLDEALDDNEKMKPDAEPQAIIQYLSKRIVEVDIDSPYSIRRTMKKLKWMGKPSSESGATACPCCQRAMDETTLAVFNARMDSLANLEESDIIRIDQEKLERTNIALKNYEEWRTKGNYFLR